MLVIIHSCTLSLPQAHSWQASCSKRLLPARLQLPATMSEELGIYMAIGLQKIHCSRGTLVCSRLRFDTRLVL